MYKGVWWVDWTGNSLTGLPNYRLQSPLHRSDWTDSIAAKTYSSLLPHTHTHSHVDILTPTTSTFLRLPWMAAVCLTSLSGLEWGPRHLGPNQSLRTNAGRGRRAGPCSLYCVLWRPARHTAVLLKLCYRTWEVKASWLTNHMLKQFNRFQRGIIVGDDGCVLLEQMVFHLHVAILSFRFTSGRIWS